MGGATVMENTMETKLNKVVELYFKGFYYREALRMVRDETIQTSRESIKRN